MLLLNRKPGMGMTFSLKVCVVSLKSSITGDVRPHHMCFVHGWCGRVHTVMKSHGI